MSKNVTKPEVIAVPLQEFAKYEQQLREAKELAQREYYAARRSKVSHNLAIAVLVEAIMSRFAK